MAESAKKAVAIVMLCLHKNWNALFTCLYTLLALIHISIALRVKAFLPPKRWLDAFEESFTRAFLCMNTRIPCKSCQLKFEQHGGRTSEDHLQLCNLSWMAPITAGEGTSPRQ